jgi:hypothetical protein
MPNDRPTIETGQLPQTDNARKTGPSQSREQTSSPDILSGSAMQASKPRRKIIGFDSWTGGGFAFERLLPAFAARGLDFLLIHIGSWGSDPGRPSREMLGPIEARDIKYYNDAWFDEVLEFEKPDAVLFLSTRTFAHRAVVRYCEQRSIPSLHLYHGIANVQVTNDYKGSHRIARVAYALYALSRIGKLVRRTFPCYIRALWKTRASLREWRRFIGDVGRFARGVPFLKAADDSRTTRCAVYTNADVEHAVRVYGFEPGEVAAVGNPDLVRFGLRPHMLGMMNRPSTAELELMMYVDTALAIVGLLFKSRGAFIDHLKATATALAAQGKRLAFKPHPAHDANALRRDLDGSGIELVANEDFVSRLQQCCGCIAETTSVALVPAVLGLPVFCACYGDLRTQRFGPVLSSYPRGYLLEDVTNFSEILSRDAMTLDPKRVDDWIAFNCGPLPAEDMPARVAALLDQMISMRSELRSA